MSNRILTTGGFDKIHSLPSQGQESPKVSLYRLKDLTPQKIARAKAALEQRLQKNEKYHYTYKNDLKRFDEEIKEKPYLMKEGTKLYLLEGRKIQQEGTVSHLVTLSQKTIYLFQNRVAVGGNFSIGDNVKIDNLVLQFPEVSSKQSSHPPSLAELTQQLSEHLASFYKKQITAVYKIQLKGAWKISLPIEGIYTNLAIIGEDERKEKNDSKQTFQDRRAPTYETLFKPKQPIAPQDIFNHEKLKNVSQKRAVIFGVAGVGKTTFCEMVAMRGTELWPEFKVVFLLKLRNLNKENYPLGLSTPYDFLARECHFDLATYSTLLDDPTFREKTLLLLDGYDELPKEAERGSLANAFQELKQRFPHIVVTSRPMPVDIDYATELEIIGFDETSINSYIEKYYHLLAQRKDISEEEATRKTHQLQEEIKEHSILESLVQIPINLSLACSLFKEDESFFDSTQKFSLTNFYVEASNWCYKKYQLRPGMSNLSESDIRQQKNPRWMSEKINRLAQALEEIAWGAMKRDTLYPDQDFIENILSKLGLNLDDLTHSGLLSVEEGQGQFIHLTFQEYYAASHLVSLLKKPATQARACRFIREEKYNPRMQIVFWFAAGLCSLDKNDISSSSSSSSNTSLIDSFFQAMVTAPQDIFGIYDAQLYVRLLEEAGLPETKEATAFRDKIDRWVIPASSNREKQPFDVLAPFLVLSPHYTKNYYIPKYLQLLQKGNKDDKIRVCHVLSLLAIGDEKVVKGLLLLIETPGTDPWIQNAAQRVLRKLKMPESQAQEVMSTLLKFIQTPGTDREVQEVAWRTLGNLKVPESQAQEVTSTLLKFIQTPGTDPYVQEAAWGVLENLKVPESQVQEVVSTLLKFIQTPGTDPWVQKAACGVLENLKVSESRIQDVVESLLKLIQTPGTDREVQEAAYRALGSLKVPESRVQEIAKSLLRRIKTPGTDTDDQETACRALENLKVPESQVQKAVNRFLKLIQTPGTHLFAREAACRELENLKVPESRIQEVVESLLKLIQTPSNYLFAQEAACSALKNLKMSDLQAQEVVSALLRLIQVSDIDSDRLSFTLKNSIFLLLLQEKNLDSMNPSQFKALVTCDTPEAFTRRWIKSSFNLSRFFTDCFKHQFFEKECTEVIIRLALEGQSTLYLDQGKLHLHQRTGKEPFPKEGTCSEDCLQFIDRLKETWEHIMQQEKSFNEVLTTATTNTTATTTTTSTTVTTLTTTLNTAQQHLTSLLSSSVSPNKGGS